MAYIREEHCVLYKKETEHKNTDCVPCKQKKEKEEESDWLSHRINVKLLDLYRRIKKLENRGISKL